MTIKFKFTIFISSIILLMILGSSSFLYYTEKKLLQEQLKDYQQSIITGLSQVVRESILTGDELLIINYINLLKRTVPAMSSAYVLNNDGIILAHTDSGLINKKLQKTGSVLSDDIVRIESPVYIGEKKIAKSFVGFYKEKLKNNLDAELEKTRNKMFSMMFFASIIGLVGSWLFSYFITEPIGRLSAGAEIIGSGNLDHKIDVKRNDELGNLAMHFNAMSVKLKELDEMKKDFTSTITHELRSPLSAIETYVNLLLSKNPEYERENFLRIQKNIARLRNFINDLLDLAKIEKGKMEIIKFPFDLSEAIRDIIDLFRAQASDKGITIDFISNINMVKINGDENRIKQVLTNLISNAIKFTPGNGKITVSASAEFIKQDIADSAGKADAVPKFVKVSVADTGIGIPDVFLDKVFGKFEQVKSGREQVKGPKGTGLGLSIAKAIVELHNGKIWLDTVPDKGAVFHFILPV